MTKRELQRQIEELRERVRELEARPPAYVYPQTPYIFPQSYPSLPATPWPQPYGTGDPLPVLPTTWCCPNDY